MTIQETLWYIHKNGKTAGPFSSSAVLDLLSANRIQFVDYAWSEGLLKWVKILDIDEFLVAAPPYPKSPIPPKTAIAGQGPEQPQAVPQPIPQPITMPQPQMPQPQQNQWYQQPIAQPQPQPQYAPPTLQYPMENPQPGFPPQQNFPYQNQQPNGIPPRPQHMVAPQTSLPKQPLHNQFAPHSHEEDWPKARRFSRYFITAEAVIGNHTYEIINISEGGVFVKTDQQLPVGNEVNFILTSNNFSRPMEMTGLVIRQGFAATVDSGKALGYAVEFVRINPIFKRMIRQFIEECSPKMVA